MIHLQRTVPNWTEALHRLPDKSLVKSVDNGQVFAEVKAVNPNIYTCLRHHYDHGQVFGGTYAENKVRAREFFATFIDDTFKQEIAPHCDFVEEWNEYLANSQNAYEVAERVMWAEAAADVWANEYRVLPELAHIRLVLCNTAVGNSIPGGFFEIAKDRDCLLGYHPYTYWKNKVRGDYDWSTLSGLWDGMETYNGIDADWLFTEAGPFESAIDGWRSDKCLGADRALYIEAMRQWIRDVQQTDAYQEGRIYGFALFTTGRAGDVWKHFWTEQPELNDLSDMIAQEWNPGTYVPPVEPPVEPECRGQPREQYNRTYNVIPGDATDGEAVSIFLEGWQRSKETSGGSYDDAGIGDLDQRTARLYGIDPDLRQEYLNWYVENYPGVQVFFVNMPGSGTQADWLWPVDSTTHSINSPFDHQRSYGPHEGVDLYAAYLDSILASRDGIVTWASNRRRSTGELSDYGYHVVVDHQDGFVSWYAHMEHLLVDEGDVVNQGSVLGKAGSTGNSTGVHLHFSIQKMNAGLSGYVLKDVIDPTPLLGL